MNEEQLKEALKEIISDTTDLTVNTAIVNILELLIKLEGLNKEGRLILLEEMKKTFEEELKKSKIN